MRVLFEDNHLLLVDKPHNLVTQTTEGHIDSLEERAKQYLKKKYQKPGNVFLHAVHRLDKEVGGIVIFAKTSKALSRMNALIREKKLKKIYRARVEGHCKHKQGSLSHTLLKQEHRSQVSPQEGKESTLHYQVIQEEKKSSIVEITLETGRYHQIRVQMSYEGHPILGDTKYGSSISYHDGHIDLKHVRVEFMHPIQQSLVMITTEGFSDF